MKRTMSELISRVSLLAVVAGLVAGCEAGVVVLL